MYNEGIKTFQAGEDLAARRLVKVESATTNDPPEVVYADSGEDAIGVTEYAVDDGDLVAVRLLNAAGTFEIECLVDSAIARGTELYVDDDGRVSDASSGSVIGIALETGTDNAHIEVFAYEKKATTAAGTTIADSGAFTATSTVEAALQEIYQHLLTAQAFLPAPLTTWFEGDGTNTVAALGPSTAPTLDMANGDTDSGLLITWVATEVDPIITQIPLPPDLDAGSDLVLHLRAAAGGTDDTITLNADSYFNEGDTKVEDSVDVSGTAYAEKEITIAAADIPAGAQTLTIELTPGAHANDALIISSAWIEYQRATLTS